MILQSPPKESIHLRQSEEQVKFVKICAHMTESSGFNVNYLQQLYKKEISSLIHKKSGILSI